MTSTTTILAAIVCLTIAILGLLGYAAVRVFTRSRYQIAELEISHDAKREAMRHDDTDRRMLLLTEICKQYMPIFELAMRRFVNADDRNEPELWVWHFESTDELRTWAVVAGGPGLAHTRVIEHSPAYAGQIILLGRQTMDDGSFIEFETAKAGRKREAGIEPDEADLS